MAILRFLLCILSFSGLCAKSQACIALRGKSFNNQKQQNKKNELVINDADVTAKRNLLNSRSFFTQQRMTAMVPTNLQPTNQGNHVRDKILEKTGQSIGNSIVKSEAVQKSFLFKTAKKVEKTAKLDMTVKAAKPALPGGPKPINHKFKVDVQAFKQKARLVYKGYVDSSVEYRTQNDQIIVSLEEKLGNNSRIALSHTQDRDQSSQYLFYQLNW